MKTEFTMLDKFFLAVATGSALASAIVIDRVDDKFDVVIEEVDKLDLILEPPVKVWREPYGGCKEAARYPGTPGYNQCKAHGLLP